MSRESPFLSNEVHPWRPAQESSKDFDRLLRESPFATTGVEREAAPEWEADEGSDALEAQLDEEQPGCTHELGDYEVSFESEAWSASPEQVAFRDRVLAKAIAQSKAARGAPQRDLLPSELATVPGTNVQTLPSTAAAAGRLLAAATAALAKAQQAGDVDAQRTVSLSATSGYRGSEHQRSLWHRYFANKYYKRTEAARDKLAGGPHSDAAVDYMLRPVKAGGYGVGGRIAAPGYSNHQGGIAIDFWQERKKGHYIGNDSDDPSRARWRATWFHHWLRDNAATHGFKPIPTEEWHWEYRPGAASATQAAANAAPVANAAEQIRFAQRVLNATEGEQLGDDGIAGKLTRAAITRFRTKYGLGAGGDVNAATEIALAQRALEELAQASMFAQFGQRDAKTDQMLGSFRAQRGLGLGSTLDAATRLALTDALARRPVSTSSGGTSAAVSGHLGGKLWTFTPPSLGRPVAVFCPPNAIGRSDVDVLVFVHGLLSGCPTLKQVPAGFVNEAPFNLGKSVTTSGRPLVLVVPFLDWSNTGGAAAFGKGRDKWHMLAKPATLNAMLAEVLRDIGRVQSITPPTLRELMISGHSRAYDFLEPLAHSRTDPQMQQGALARLTRVWAFDTTYAGDVSRWTDWLKRDARLQVAYFYQPLRVGAAKPEDRTKPSGTAAVGDAFYAQRSARLAVTRVKEGHCAVPATQLAMLLRPTAVQQPEVMADEANPFADWFDSRETTADVAEPAAELESDWDATEATDVGSEELEDDLSETWLLDPSDNEDEPQAEAEESDQSMEYDTEEYEAEHGCCGGHEPQP